MPYRGKPKEPKIISQPQGEPLYGWDDDPILDNEIEIDTEIEFAKQLAEEWTVREDWQREIERKAKAALGDEYYQRSRSRSTLKMCRQLAREAEFLLNVTKRAEQSIEDVLTPALAWIRPTSLQRIIAQKFAKRITAAAGADIFTTVARALRCYGVFICATDDQVDLMNCHCLRPLAMSETRAKIEAEVRAVVGRGFKLWMSDRAKVQLSASEFRSAQDQMCACPCQQDGSLEPLAREPAHGEAEYC